MTWSKFKKIEMSVNLLNYLILLVGILVGVAFVTLMEQKILAASQVRVGPNYVGWMGMMQPFSDAVKLFVKEGLSLQVGLVSLYYMSPVLSLSLILVLWCVFPFKQGGLMYSYAVLYFVCISGLGVYPILSMGWASNNKYSILGSLRAVAQMISYEVSLMMIFISLIWVMKSFDLKVLLESQGLLCNMLILTPLGLIWLVSSIAETNRTPYDFAEGESELVSGFNIEYSSIGFTLIFMSEYASILFMSTMFSILFFGLVAGFSLMMMSMMIVVVFVWVRTTLPRYRYDKLMSLAWKVFLPITLVLFFYSLSIGLGL